MHLGYVTQPDASGIDIGDRVDKGLVFALLQLIDAKSAGQNADAERLGDNDFVARPRGGIGLDLFRVDHAHHRQTENRLRIFDGVAAGQWHPGAGADIDAPAHDLLQRFGFDVVDGETGDGGRHDRGAAHGVDVAQGVGGRRAAIDIRIVHQRRLEIVGKHQCLFTIYLVDGCVVGVFHPHQQIRVRTHSGHVLKNAFQFRGLDLTAAAAAVGERCESLPDFFCGGWGDEGGLKGCLKRTKL